MSIKFKTINWRNFLSTGNSPNTIQLNRSQSTLIIGKNGEGKSTILDAITFALFGKPFRNINKPQLINSINGKNCLVEVEFDIGTSQYKVVRGLRPNIFEVYLNGNLMNQDAAARDYQTVLEQQILKLSYKTFTQVVILGSASFVPFMQLPTGQRRNVIEDILDISIFSTMNQLLKERSSATNEKIKDVESQIEMSRNNVSVQKRLIQTMEESKEGHIGQIRSQMDSNDAEIEVNEKRAEEINQKIAELTEKIGNQEEIGDQLNQARKTQHKFHAMKESADSTIEFFKNNTTCPSCEQGIPHEHKESIIGKLESENTELDEKLNVIQEAYDKLTDKQATIKKLIEEINLLQTQLFGAVSTAKNLRKQNKSLQAQLEEKQQDTSNIDEEKKKLKDIANEAMELVKLKTKLLSDKDIQSTASILLKDTGVKTAIIREYLPVMNQLINQYLSAMDFYVHFELDESFNEVIKSRHRDEFTYASFSEGEKMRIDLAILFTWRQIAKMKNSVNTNLLLLDEIFDSSLDVSGTDYFMHIMNSLQDKTNVFVISHKGDQLFDKFHSVIRVEKRNDFSVIAGA